MSCPLCGDKRHVKTDSGWERCKCLGPILDKQFIKPGLRSGMDTYPPEFDKFSPYPLTDYSVAGSWSQFPSWKCMVWRSLVQYRDKGFRYEYMDAYRLVEIFFRKEEDEGYTIRQLAELDLLVMALGMADLPNKLLPGLIVQALTLRKDAGRPTWIFAPWPSRTRIKDVYGSDVAELVGNLHSVTGGSVDAIEVPVSGKPTKKFNLGMK